MGFNVLLFVVVQLWLEPWKRKRLVGGFEEKVREVIQEEGLRNALLNLHVEPEAITPIVEAAREAAEEVVDGTADVVDSEPVLLEEDIVHTSGEGEAPIEEIAAMEAEKEAIEAAEQQEKKIWERALGEVVKWVEFASEQVDEAFSERVILIKKVDLATAILEGVALGAFATALISLVLNNM